MHFDSFSDLLAMGGYGGYIWSAFGITFGSMLMLVWLSKRRHRQLLNDVQSRQARQARIEAAKNMENTL